MQEQNPTPSAQTTPEEVRVQAKNFAELRSIAEAARQENAQLKQNMAKLEEKLLSATAPKDPEYDSNEPYVDHKRLQAEISRVRKESREDIDKIAKEEARKLIEEERRADYLNENKDFEEVLALENIKEFVSSNPKIAAVMNKMPDNFERQQLLYESIKTFKASKPAQQAAPEAPKSLLAQAFEGRKAQMAYQPGGNAGGPFASMGDFSQNGMKTAYERFKSIQKTVNI